MKDRSPFPPTSREAIRRQPPDEQGRLLRGDEQSGGTAGGASGTDDYDQGNTDSNIEDEEAESDNEDGVRDETPLLPLFSAAHLGSRAVLSILVPVELC